MKIVIPMAATTLGILVLGGGLSTTSDLRGSPAAGDISGPQRLLSAQPGAPDFVISDCLPWTVDLYALPRAGDDLGSATGTFVSCRSRSSAVRWFSLYTLGITLIGLAWGLAARTRRGRQRGALA